MIERFKIGRGQTAPVLRGTVERENDATYDISAASAVFRMWDAYSREVIIDDAAATVISATKLQYEFTALDTATPGDYEGVFIITYPDGSTEVAPGGAYGDPDAIPITITDIPSA
jgi:hypothetical protein